MYDVEKPVGPNALGRVSTSTQHCRAQGRGIDLCFNSDLTPPTRDGSQASVYRNRDLWTKRQTPDQTRIRTRTASAASYLTIEFWPRLALTLVSTQIALRLAGQILDLAAAVTACTPLTTLLQRAY